MAARTFESCWCESLAHDRERDGREKRKTAGQECEQLRGSMVCEAHAQTGDRHDEDDAGPLTEPESVLDDELPAGLLFISAVGVGNGGHARDIGRRTGRLKFPPEGPT